MRNGAARLAITALALFCTGAWPASKAVSQTYPAGPVRLIVPSGAGSGPDVTARIVADQLTRLWGRQIAVINHAGAGGAIGVRAAGTSPADGYTLYFAVASNFVALPELQATLPFDLARDFTPIGFIGEQPMVIGASPALGVSSLPELIAMAKKQPGKINIGVLNRGGIPHLTGERLRGASGTELTMIHYAATPQVLNDVVGGRIDIVIDGLPGLAGSISGGSIRPLAVGSRQRLSNLPNVATLAETWPGFLAAGWFALMAPPGTPQAIAREVSDDLRAVLVQPELTQRFEDLGTYVHPTSPEELSDFIRIEQRTWKPIIAEIGLNNQN